MEAETHTSHNSVPRANKEWQENKQHKDSHRGIAVSEERQNIQQSANHREQVRLSDDYCELRGNHSQKKEDVITPDE